MRANPIGIKFLKSWAPLRVAAEPSDTYWWLFSKMSFTLAHIYSCSRFPLPVFLFCCCCSWIWDTIIWMVDELVRLGCNPTSGTWLHQCDGDSTKVVGCYDCFESILCAAFYPLLWWRPGLLHKLYLWKFKFCINMLWLITDTLILKISLQVPINCLNADTIPC